MIDHLVPAVELQVAKLPDGLEAAPLPATHDPLASGILMAHQRAWLDDKASLKLCEKGRRTGITYAEALDDTLIAASSKSAGGDNVFYIGDTKEKGLEFIRYVAHFARIVARELLQVDEFLFEDRREDGTSRAIAAYRITFASGFRVVALSSRPANIRGLQGTVVIDEAAFHDDVAAVIDAVNALLIWGGRIRIISTHNGEDNAFNQLIKDTRAGLYDYSIHRITFSNAVANGLYERVCLIRGWTPSAEAKAEWLGRILRSYGPRVEAREEELDAVPRRSSGAYLPRSLVAAAQIPGVPVITWAKGEAWYLDPQRLLVAQEWFAENIRPLLERLERNRRHVFGQDMGRDGDLSVIVVHADAGGGRWRTAFQIELRRIPFDVQWLIASGILEDLPRFCAAFDARGNGQAHAEAAQQLFGIARVTCVKATVAWYAEHFPTYRAALEDKSIGLPDGEDVLTDHRAAILRAGFPAISDARFKGKDGEGRHGDCLVAHLLAHSASKAGEVRMEFQSTGRRVSRAATRDYMGIDR